MKKEKNGKEVKVEHISPTVDKAGPYTFTKRTDKEVRQEFSFCWQVPLYIIIVGGLGALILYVIAYFAGTL